MHFSTKYSKLLIRLQRGIQRKLTPFERTTLENNNSHFPRTIASSENVILENQLTILGREPRSLHPTLSTGGS